MIGQWMGKARRMAADFQGQFQEAMREAEVAEMKQQFDDLSKQADSYNPAKILEGTHKDVESALKFDATPDAQAPVTPVEQTPVPPPESVTPETPVVTDAPPSAGDGKPS